MGDSWKDGLLVYLTRPEDRNDVVYYDDKIVVALDKYPKATLHLLVIPREILPLGVGDLGEEHLPLLHHIASLVASVSSLPLRIGFHAVPSMRQLHLHIISDDFSSPTLKNKKHWNSFTSSFFKSLDSVIEAIESKRRFNVDAEYEEEKLSGKLVCHKCSEAFAQIPKLKQHLASVHPASPDMTLDSVLACLKTSKKRQAPASPEDVPSKRHASLTDPKES
ncbi:unnamed protein product [Aphanomyces euteiches]